MENLINSSRLPFDIRAEVLARLLSEKHDLSLEQILFRPRDFFQRWGRRDVLEVSEGYSSKMEKTTICLDVCREGLFDILPDGLFLHPDDPYPDNKAQSLALSEQESAARKFLLPFEQLFFWLAIENEFREYESENQLETWWQQYLSDEYSTFDKSQLNDKQKEIYEQLAPHLPDIVGNWSLTEEWLSLLLKTKISLQEVPPKVYDLPEVVQKRMGEGVLGQDFVIGSTFSDGIPIVQISIKGLTPDNLHDYLNQGDQRELIENELLPIFLPIETPYEISIGVKTQSTFFKLCQNSNNAVLGYTTVCEKS
jgi:type VI secretion system protein ImpH